MPHSPRMASNPISIARQQANRANAQKSTGPRSAEGKKRSSLNALRHGFTSHIVVLPSEDASAFQAFVAKCHKMYAPETGQEIELVETLANTRWRLNRCGALEANLFSLGHEQHAAKFHTGDEPENQSIQTGLAAAATFQESADTFLKLSLYEQRLMRLYQTTKAELLKLQETRRQAAETEYEETSQIRNLHIQNGRIFHPADFGFVSNIAQIEQLARKNNALEGYFDPETASPEGSAL